MSVAKPLDCYLGGVGTVPASNSDIGMMKARHGKLRAISDAYKELTEKEAALCQRMDKLSRRMSRRDECGDVETCDPEAAKPLAAR